MKSGPHSSENRLEQELERRILHGLAAEWENAVCMLPSELRKAMKKPLFRLADMKSRLGCWTGHKREICLNREFVLSHPWDSVRDVLRHETAHQLTALLSGGKNEPPHGPVFRKACELLRADPKASGKYESLRERIRRGTAGSEDKILLRVQKLMALAQSSNRHEAESAMHKAHALIARHNLELISLRQKRDFVSIFLGKPALRRFREEYALGALLEDFYFVQGIWVSTWVVEKEKMGRVLEISGTEQNVRMTGYIYDFVNHYIKRQWEEYKKGKRLSRYRKTDFALGILEGFRFKLENAAKEKGTETYALIKSGDPRLRQYMRHRYPRIKGIRPNPLRQDPDIVEEGIRIGKKMVIYQGISEKGSASEKRSLPE